MGPLGYLVRELWRTLSRHRTLCLASILSTSSILLILLLLVMLFSSKRYPSFTADDRAAARAIATCHPPTDFLLRMPSTGVSR